MNSYFVVTIQFMDGRFHGKMEGNKPEWPPSPMRVFQSMVATAARSKGGEPDGLALSALRWLEGLAAPLISAPPAFYQDNTPGYCLSVPNNAMDIVARAWSKGNYTNKGDSSPATHRTMKTVRPVHFMEDRPVSYIWDVGADLSEDAKKNTSTLQGLARGISSLGWGIDMVVANGEVLSNTHVKELAGEKWYPGYQSGDGGLRIPVVGTVDDLAARHKGFLKRLEGNVFVPPPALTKFEKVDYRRSIQPPFRATASFSILKPDASGFQPFAVTKWALTVAGMTRHATANASKQSGWAKAEINSFVLGHGESRDNKEHITVGNKRFAYLPLPSVEFRGHGKSPVIGDIRRVMLTVFDNEENNNVNWAKRALSGQTLIYENTNNTGELEEVALLSLLPSSDTVSQFYTRSHSTWISVTPVILPGFDDPSGFRKRLRSGVTADDQKRLLSELHERIDTLLRKAILHAGFSAELAKFAHIEWRKGGFCRGIDMADQYGIPGHLKKFPRYHVRIHWRDGNLQPIEIQGPICIGGGRFFGLGLFAAMD
ncbi:MAG: type I-U CRISPR-associated protein Cas5/Cas6 [Leptonema illini]|uniref:Type I-U CRISPR-associated protein Cas5/Cas6 n=1 Tax=Leptonema illini TaxID=183 RepID=A0A833GZ46_9LEPT|nr:MAG: type I-U CRISPR-associated protein Cas5/Cas6 [Leptonema illini]